MLARYKAQLYKGLAQGRPPFLSRLPASQFHISASLKMPSKRALEAQDNAVFTTSNGAPVAEPYAAQRIGFHGPLLLQGEYCLSLIIAVALTRFQTST